MLKISRRRFARSSLGLLLLGPTACASVESQAGLQRTPSQGEGPYYPVDFPPDVDNDLVGARRPGAGAQGDWLRLQGRVQDLQGRPMAGVMVEIWEADHQGIYRHPQELRDGRVVDANYRGFGRHRTDAEGRYEFITIVPAPYTGRPPHIHVKLRAPGRDVLTTQLYLKGHPDNDRDGWFSWLLFRNKDRLLIDPQPAARLAGRPLQQAGYDFVV